MTQPAVRLINCKRDPVYVSVDGRRVELPRSRHPTIVDGPDWDNETLAVEIDGVTTKLLVETGDVDLTIGLPPVRDGVVYLVDDALLLRAPHRDDFVTDSHYQIDLEATGPAADDLGSVLISVRRHLAPIGPDTPDLDLATLTSADAAIGFHSRKPAFFHSRGTAAATRVCRWFPGVTGLAHEVLEVEVEACEPEWYVALRDGGIGVPLATTRELVGSQSPFRSSMRDPLRVAQVTAALRDSEDPFAGDAATAADRLRWYRRAVGDRVGQWDRSQAELAGRGGELPAAVIEEDPSLVVALSEERRASVFGSLPVKAVRTLELRPLVAAWADRVLVDGGRRRLAAELWEGFAGTFDDLEALINRGCQEVCVRLVN